MQALDWIGKLVEWFASLIPHVGICRASHAGVKFVRGSRVKRIDPGVYVWWPIVTEVELFPVKRQTLNLPCQTLTTSDGETVIISIVVVFEITDIEKALVDSWDVEDTVSDVALRASVEIVTRCAFDSLRSNLAGHVQNEITKSCRKLLAPYGVRVQKCLVTDFAKTTVYRLVGEHGTGRALPAPGLFGGDAS